MIPLDAEAVTYLPGLTAAIRRRLAAVETTRTNRDRLEAELAAEVQTNGQGTKAYDRLAMFAELARGSVGDNDAMLAELLVLFEVLAPRVSHTLCKVTSP